MAYAAIWFHRNRLLDFFDSSTFGLGSIMATVDILKDRKGQVDRWQDKFGHKFIVLPNQVYGKWVDAIYNYDRMLTPEQQATMRKEALKSY